jgi:hypothetical protein
MALTYTNAGYNEKSIHRKRQSYVDTRNIVALGPILKKD